MTKPLRAALGQTDFQFDPEKEFKNRSVGIISAERGHLSPDQNATRTKSLLDDLNKTGHNVTRATGGFIENFGKPNAQDVTGEQSFIVSHPKTGNDNGSIERALSMLGQKYDQDSILFKPFNSDEASFLGTNTTGSPGLGKREGIGKMKMKKGEFHTKLPDGRCFSFEKD